MKIFGVFQVVKNGLAKMKILHSLIILDLHNELCKVVPKDTTDGYQAL